MLHVILLVLHHSPQHVHLRLSLSLCVSVFMRTIITTETRTWVYAATPWLNAPALLAIESKASIIGPGAYRGTLQL